MRSPRLNPARSASASLLALLFLAATATAADDGLRDRAFAALWNEDAAGAIPLFREYLAAHGGDREAGRGLALACSWDGRQAEAARLYRELLAADANDGESRVGLGRALLWDNRLGEGWATLRAAEASAPATEAARSAGDVMLVALDEYAAPLAVAAGATWDSDDLTVTRLGATATFTVGGNRLLQAMPSHAWFEQPGQPDARALRLGAGLVTGLGPRWSLHAYGWLDRFATDAPLPATAEPLDWDVAGGDAWLTWLPAPRWRLDLGAASQPVETYLALGQRLERRQASLSLEHRVSRHWAAGVVGIAGAYTDENRSDRLTARVTWRHDGKVLWQAGPVLNLLDFRVPYPGAYWAPDGMSSLGFEASVRGRGRRLAWRVGGSLASEKETGARAVSVGGVNGRLGWRVARDWLVGLEAGHAAGSLNSASGYRRSTLSVDVRAFF